MPVEVKILIVDDHEFLRKTIVLALGKIGYSEIYELEKGRDVLPFLKQNRVDVILMDINFGEGEMNGIETTHLIYNHGYNIPVIFMSSLTSDDYIMEANKTKLFAIYLDKPIQQTTLALQVKTVLLQKALYQSEEKQEKQGFFNRLFGKKNNSSKQEEVKEDDNFIIDDNIYYTSGFTKKIVPLEDILWIEVEDKYCTVNTKSFDFVIRISMSLMLKKLNKDYFFRVHNSFIVNIKLIDRFQDDYVTLQSGKSIPVSRRKKKELQMKMEDYN